MLFTYLFSTHRFKHLLKLDTQLLHIIHQDTRLRTDGERERGFIRKDVELAEMSWKVSGERLTIFSLSQ